MSQLRLRKAFSVVLPTTRWNGEITRQRFTRTGRLGHYLSLLIPLFIGTSNLRCGPFGPCHPEHQGKTFTVTILKRISLYDCPLPDPDPLIGQSFSIRVEGTGSNGKACACGTGPIVSSPDAVDWSNASAPSCASNMYGAEVDVTLGECTTTASLFLSGNVTTSSDPNDSGASLNYNENTCLCGGSFQVAIREVPNTAPQ
jgi:hypothetical protein